MNNKIFICGVKEVPFYSDKKIDTIVSIGLPHDDLPDIREFHGLKNVFRFYFDDVEDGSEEYVKDCLENGYIYPSERDVAGMYSLLINNPNVLIHCHGGISRSTAVAYVAIAHILEGVHGKVDDELLEKSWQELIKIRPKAQPNIYIIKTLDRICGYNKKLLSFVVKKLNMSDYDINADFVAKHKKQNGN